MKKGLCSNPLTEAVVKKRGLAASCSELISVVVEIGDAE
jgi:hypothetical protein